MKVTVVGTGNVGAALLFSLANNQAIDQIAVSSRKPETATAAILDVASAFPKAAAKMRFETPEMISDSDIIVITAGVTQKGKTAGETHGPNLKIAEDVVRATSLKQSAVLICVATPVDDLTVEVQRIAGLPTKQVIGFGGDLDSNRLQYILQARGIPNESAVAIGEHGPNAVPVYQGEASYDEVTNELHQFWLKIAKHVDIVRNLATAELIARLVDSIATDAKRTHNVCAYQADYGVHLTWPFVIGRGGAEQASKVELSQNSARALDALADARKQRLSVSI